MRAPIIVSALFGAADHRWLDAQRKAHFPPERNVLAAHLTLFHHLPPSVEAELCGRLQAACRAPAPDAKVSGLINLGRGVAYLVESPGLVAIRDDLAVAFAGVLTPQDANRWRPHVTIQNKVRPETARSLLRALEREFCVRPLAIAGLAAWRYRDGPWEPIAAYAFGLGRKMASPPC